MSYIDHHIPMEHPSDASFGIMMLFSFLFHGLLVVAVLGLSTLTFGKGPYMPTIYEVELVSLSTQPLAAPSQAGNEMKLPSSQELAPAPPVVESPSEPAVVLPAELLEKKRIQPKPLNHKPEVEEVKKPQPKPEVKNTPSPPKQETQRPAEKPVASPDASAKVKEIRNRAAQAGQSGDKTKPKDATDIQIIGGSSGGSLLGRAHGAVASMQLKMYLNQIRERIESMLIWPSALEENKDWITQVSIRIVREGKIENFQIEKKSGNAFFDEAVWRAINKANPLPPLPDTYQGTMLEVLCAFHSKKE